MAEKDQDDEQNIIQALKAMKVKSKADTPEEFMTWINEFLKRKRAGKPPISLKHVAVPIHKSTKNIFLFWRKRKGRISI